MLAVALLAFGSGGCPLFSGPEDTGPSRCEQDRYDCQDRSDVPAADGCDLEGELSVEIGAGLEAFEPMSDGEPPREYSGGGGFQGPAAMHVGVGLRIGGAALDRYDVIGARVGVYEAGACMTMADGSQMCDGVPWIADRSVLLGDGPALNVVDGMVEEFGLTMPIEPLTPGQYVVQAIVEDPCGQLGVAHHPYTL